MHVNLKHQSHNLIYVFYFYTFFLNINQEEADHTSNTVKTHVLYLNTEII